MKRIFSLTRALVARKRKIFALFFALAASIGMMNAKVTWNRCNISDLDVHGTNASYSKEGVTLSANADHIFAMWQGYGDESHDGISFMTMDETGGFTFSNTLGKNFTKIEMFPNGPGIWDMANLGSGWSFSWDPSENKPVTVTWTGNASTVDLVKDVSDFHGENVKKIVFYFEGDSEEPDPTYTVALKDGTANADKVTLSATSVEECTTVTVTPNEECDITAFKATYNTTEELSTSFNTETGAYSFTMPAANVTIEATIALKPLPEGDVFAGFTATAGSGGFNNEGHANLVDNKFTSTDWTKWCADNSYKSVPTGESGDACWWIDFEASAALNLTGYILTTGNDSGNEHGRNPKNWLLKAKLNAGDAWTTIATVTNDVTMKNQSFKDYKFFVDQSGSYKYFRFEVFANQGANVMQLCQLRLIGTEAAGGGSTPTVTWNSSNVSDLDVQGTSKSYSKEGVTLSANGDDINAKWYDMGDESLIGIAFNAIRTGGYTFSNTLGKNFTKIEIFPYSYHGWDNANLGSGWSISGVYDSPFTVTWTGNASTVDMAKDESTFTGAEFVKSIVFYFEGGSEPAPANSCGDGLTWELNNGELVISYDGEGTGVMNDYDIPHDNLAPWYANRENITSVSLPEGIKTIGKDAFRDCVNLTTVTIPNSVTTIGESAFVTVEHLETVTIGTGITSIVNGAFYGNAELTTVTCSATTPPSIGEMVFGSCTNLEHIYVPTESVDAYKTAWSDYASLISAAAPANQLYMEVDGTAGTLKWGLAGSNPVYDGDAIQYSDRKYITTLTIDESCQNHTLTSFYNLFHIFKALTTINGIENLATANVENMRYMFYDCQSLTSLDLSSFNTANVTDMKGMFNGCSNLTTIYVGDGWNTSAVTDGNAMFYGCTNLPNYDSGATGVDKAYVGAGGYLSAMLTPADVMALINAIGTVEYTAECKAKIDAARAAYDALNDGDKAQVTNLTTLTNAEGAYAQLLAQAVKAVKDQIDALPALPLTDATKKLSEYNKVTAAREAYDALSDEEKAAVTNYDKLTAAEAAFAAIGGGDAGALKGKFSVADGKVVYFSKGNLQASTTDNGTNWTWAFAANQYDCVADNAANTAISGDGTVSTNGTVDLFGWSTAATQYGIHVKPYNSTYSGDFVDWGSNPALTAALGEDWRTLTSDEWTYLLDTRTTTSGVRYAKAEITDKTYPGTTTTIKGLIILPDDWSTDYHALASTNTADAAFTSNQITSTVWENELVAHGAVFMPAAGYRLATSIYSYSDRGYYWSATPNGAENAYELIFIGDNVYLADNGRRFDGHSVRLVTENAPASPLADAQAAKDLIDAIPQPVVYTPECGAAIKAAREALDALSDEAKAFFATADTAALPAAEATYAELLAQKVAPVIAAIDAIPSPIEDNIKLSVYDKVTDARALYDALSDEEKAAVSNYDKLTAAEAAFAAIGGGTGLNVSTEDIGKVLCADGSLYATKDEATAASKTPVAMIAYVEDSKGLAIALEDESNTMTWSPAITAAAAHTPAVTGGTWKLPSLLEWQQMFVGCGADLTPSETSGDVTDYLGLRDKLLAAGGNGFVEWSYWTTTEWADNPAEYAWDPYFSYSPELVNWYTNKKTRDDFYIRAILAFNVVASNDLAQAQAAKDLIDAIPQPVVLSDECKAKIDAAREAVTALGENASLLDDADIDKLEKAEADFALLIKDATAVVAKIDAIGDVTFSAESKEKIVDAREAYDALSDELKPYVTNLGTLTAAEAAYEAARPFAPVTTVPAAVEALQYTGAAQALITAGAAEHGTVLYSLDGENYSTELPTALLPGAYTIYYKVQATDDYKDVAPVTVIATIAYNYPATYSLFGIPEGWSVKVNDEEVAVVNGAVQNIAANDRFDIMPVKPEDVKRVEIVPYLLDLATVTDSVIYVLDGDSITGTANGHITVVIVPDAKVYFKDVNLTNTGSHPAVLCGGNAEIVVVGENTITCTKEGEYGIRAAGAGTTLTVSGDKTLLKATIDPNGGTVNQ